MIDDPLQLKCTDSAFGSEHEAILLKRSVIKAMAKGGEVSCHDILLGIYSAL